MDKLRDNPIEYITVNGKPLKGTLSPEECLDVLVDKLGANVCVALISSGLCRSLDLANDKPQKRGSPTKPPKSSPAVPSIEVPKSKVGSLLPAKPPTPTRYGQPNADDVLEVIQSHPGWTRDQIAKELNSPTKSIAQILIQTLIPHNKVRKTNPDERISALTQYEATHGKA